MIITKLHNGDKSIQEGISNERNQGRALEQSASEQRAEGSERLAVLRRTFRRPGAEGAEALRCEQVQHVRERPGGQIGCS